MCIRDRSITVGGLAISRKDPRVVVTDAKPTKTKLLPDIRTTFLVKPTSKEPLVIIDLTVFPPTATVAEPAPSTTSNFPDVVIEAVHLPTHFNAPTPNEGGAATHLPVREDFEAPINVLVILKSPLCPLPTQSKT